MAEKQIGAKKPEEVQDTQNLLSQAKDMARKRNESLETALTSVAYNHLSKPASRGDVNGTAQAQKTIKTLLPQMRLTDDQFLTGFEKYARENHMWNDKFAETLRAAAIISGFGSVAKQNEFTTHQNTAIDPVAKQAAILAQLTALQETINRTINSIKEGLSKEDNKRLTSEEAREESKAKKKREERNA